MGSTETDRVTGFSIEEQTNLALETLNVLGLAPDIEAARQPVEGQLSTLAYAVHQETRPAAGTLETFVGVELTAKFPIRALLSAYSSGFKTQAEYWPHLLDRYPPAELNNRAYMSGNTSVALPGTVARATAAALNIKSNHATDPSLRFVLRTKDEQMEAYEHARKSYAGARLLSTLGVMNPADYIMLNAQRQVLGVPLLDSGGTITRFSQFATRRIGGRHYMPKGYLDHGKIQIRGAKGVSRDPDAGIRIVTSARLSKADQIAA